MPTRMSRGSAIAAVLPESGYWRRMSALCGRVKGEALTLITQPCSAVGHIEKYPLYLLDTLSPVHSPMLCTVFVMRAYFIKDKIAFALAVPGENKDV